MVLGSPWKLGWEANSSEVGSTVSEYRWRSAEAGAGGSSPSAAVGGVVDLGVDRVGDPVERLAVQHALVQEEPGKRRQGIAQGFGGAFGGRFVEPLIVGERVRIGPDHVGVQQRRSAAPGGNIPRRF